MNMRLDDQQLAEKAKQLFDDSVEELDAATLSKLNQGRHAALAAASTRKTGFGWQQWVPATGLAAAAIIAIVFVQSPGTDEVGFNVAAVSDIEILLDDDGIEMYEELEFFALLESLEESEDVS